MRTVLLTIGVLSLSSLAGADEKRIEQSEVSKPALEAVRKKYPKGKLSSFTREIEQGRTSFEVVVEDGKNKVEVSLSPDGKILTEEEVIPMSAAPDTVRKALGSSAKYEKWKVKRIERVVTDEKPDAPNYEVLLIGPSKPTQRVEVTFDKEGKILKEEAGD